MKPGGKELTAQTVLRLHMARAALPTWRMRFPVLPPDIIYYITLSP